MRTFIAVELPDNIRRTIAGYIELLRGVIPQVKWVAPENLHLTMKFLGEVPEKRLDSIKECASQVVEGFSPFTVELEHVGFFPNSHHPQVIWIGSSDGVDQLLELYQKFEDCLESSGFDRDAKTFSPHLTVGQVKRHARVTIPPGIPEFEGETFEVNGISVIMSTLTPQGPLYTTLLEAPFAQHTYQNR
ncbi:RNA 2',3'-cyclic phosphodiesterase [Candidatus Latescibacterota bacterium]